MKYSPVTTSHFEKQFSKLTKKNAVFKEQAARKIKGIVLNPEIGAPKTHKLRGLRSLHITDHFVVVYMIFKDFVMVRKWDISSKQQPWSQYIQIAQGIG